MKVIWYRFNCDYEHCLAGRDQAGEAMAQDWTYYNGRYYCPAHTAPARSCEHVAVSFTTTMDPSRMKNGETGARDAAGNIFYLVPVWSKFCPLCGEAIS